MKTKGKIFLIEDNKDLNIANSRALRMRGYDVQSSLTLAEAQQQLTETEPDIILLDVMLPDGDGFTFCESIRKHTKAHIIFLTAKTEHGDMVRGFLGGGDDYMTKPFHPEELLLRIDATMRRREIDRVPLKVLRKGSLTLDVEASQALWDDTPLGLTPKEFAILFVLARHEDEVVTAETLYESIWKTPMMGDKNAIQTAVSRLRQKLEITEYTIAFVRRRGYIFCRV